MKKIIVSLILPVLLLAYSPYRDIKGKFKAMEKRTPSIARVLNIGAGLMILRVADMGPVKPDERPAIFVTANINGDYPLATEAAVRFAEELLKARPEILKKVTFYILPLGNPDAYNCYFKKPLRECHRNATAWDDDRDGQIDEDPPEDLNGDGFITKMLVKDPEGQYIHDPKDPRIVRKADPLKGEKGKYKLYVEGTDNDNDGKINEDDFGGVNIEKNFPHEWKAHTNDGGLWPASEAYTRAIIDFMFDHRNIALVYSFSKFNNLLRLPPQKQGKAVEEMKVKIPKGMAGFLGMEPDKKYTIKEIVAVVREMPFARGMNITPEMVASFFGLGPAVNINRADMKLYEKIIDQYKEFLKQKKLPVDRDVKPPADGSFEAWVYFQYGVPCFTSDIWSVPKGKKKKEGPLDKLAKMSPEEFLKLPKEKVEKMLKEMGAPPMMKAEMIIAAVRSGRITPKKMAEMASKMKKSRAEGKDAEVLAWSDKYLQGKGFVPWKKFQHPVFGDVEIGGFVPYLTTAPPLKLVEKNVEADIEFALKLAEKLPAIKFRKTELKKLSSNVYRITVWVEDSGFFPTALAHGVTNRQVPPVYVEISGADLIYGKKRERIQRIEGLTAKKLTWIVMGKKGKKVKITAFHVKSGRDQVELVLN